MLYEAEIENLLQRLRHGRKSSADVDRLILEAEAMLEVIKETKRTLTKVQRLLSDLRGIKE